VAYPDRSVPKTPPSGSRPRAKRFLGLRSALALALSAVALLAASSSALASTTLSSPYGPVYERLSYGPRWRQVTDVFQSSTPHAPIVILVHGGGWRVYAALVKFASESMALQAQGFTVFTINYDQDSELTPAFPLEPNDVALATQWAIANAARFNADPSNVTLLGGSAGGQLVATTAEQMNAASPGTIKRVVSLSGPMNFVTLLQLIHEGKITDEEFIFSVQQALGRDPGTNVFANRSEAEAYPATWSPSLQVRAESCPKWLLFNSAEEFIPLSQSQEMNSALLSANCRSSLTVVPGSKHAFGYFDRVESSIFNFIKTP
jgi:acetyl esterase/lipase